MIKQLKRVNMKKIKNIIAISSISAVVLIAEPNLPNINSSTIDRQLKTPRDIPIKQKELIDIEGAKDIELLKDDGSNKTILIKSFAISGNTKISTKIIIESIKEFENKELSFKQIQEVTQIITKLYRSEGYFVARAYVPAQNIEKNNNVLQIKIIEGKYGKIKLNNKSLVNDRVVENIFDNNSMKNGIIDYDDIQRSILLINDRSGVKVTKAEISSGEEFGSSNLDIQTVATPRADGYLLVDNYGSRYTGLYRTQLLTNINSLAKVGDKLTLSGLVSNGADLKNGRIAYELPLNSYGLTADVVYSRTNYNLAKEFKELGAHGKSNIYEAGLTYPIFLSTEQALFAKVKYYHKDLTDYYLDDKDTKYINSLEASLDYEKNYYIKNLPTRLYSSLDFTTGNLSGGNETENGRYNKIEVYVSNEVAFNNIFALSTTLTAQKTISDKNLDGNEQFSLGGVYGVKVYPYSEKSGENGYLFSNEIFANFPNISSYSHKIGLFYDIGDAYRAKIGDDGQGFERKRLKDIGIGYYSKYKDFFAKVQVAWTANSQPIQSEKESAQQNSKVLFQTGVVF